MFANWKWAHTAIAVLVFLVGGLAAMASQMPQWATWIHPVIAILGLAMGLFGVSSGKGFGSAAVLILFAACMSACAAVKPIVQGVIDIANAVCTQAEKQPEPEWVYYACTVPGAVGPIVANYMVRVPASESKAFAAAHIPK